MGRKLALIVGLACLGIRPATLYARPIFDTGEFSDPTIIDYASSPTGPITGGTPVTDQYASLGVIHDGNTTTPPGPPGMSSLSGIPGLEAGSDNLGKFIIRVTFSPPVVEIGAFFLMGGPNDDITFRTYDIGGSLVETATVLPVNMPHHPGPYGFNEGFVGFITDVPIAEAQFDAVNLAFVIDDLHFTVPEPSALTLLALGCVAAIRRRR